jgi:DNA-binding CsgD family transcriptional regulator
MEKPIRVVLVERSFLIISGIEKMIFDLPGMLLSEVFHGDEKKLLDIILLHKPEVLIINPERVGEKLALLIKVFENSAETTLIGLCSEHTEAYITSRFRHKLEIENERHEMMKQFRIIVKPLIKNEEGNNDDFSLTEREKNIVRLVAIGLSSMEIADKLFLSIHTINTHRKNILRKLGIKTASGLMVYALMNQIVNLEEIEGK